MRNREQGFSLTELLIVGAVTIIGMTVALISYAAARKTFQSEDAAGQMIRLMGNARQRAITTGRTVSLTIDIGDPTAAGAPAETQTISITELDKNGNPATDGFGNLVPVQRESLLFSSNAAGRREDQNRELIYLSDPDTVSLPPSPWQFSSLTWVNGRTATVYFQPAGKITIQRNPTSAPLSGTIFFWTPELTGGTAPANNLNNIARPDPNIPVRAVTFFGPVGHIKYWKYSPGKGINSGDPTGY